MRSRFKMSAGDRVTVEMSAYTLIAGRITFRYTPEDAGAPSLKQRGVYRPRGFDAFICDRGFMNNMPTKLIAPRIASVLTGGLMDSSIVLKAKKRAAIRSARKIQPHPAPFQKRDMQDLAEFTCYSVFSTYIGGSGRVYAEKPSTIYPNI